MPAAKYPAVAVTDQRVLPLAMSNTAKPQDVTAAVPRGQVRAAPYGPGFSAIGWKGLALGGLGEGGVKLTVPGPHPAEDRSVFETLTV